MESTKIEQRLQRISSIVKGWSSGNIPRIERDMVLEELRHLYDAVLDYNAETPEVEERPEPKVVAVVESAEDDFDKDIENSTNDIVDDFDDALDIDALLGIGLSESETSEDEIFQEETPEEQTAIEEQLVVEESKEVVEEVVERVVDEVKEEPKVEPEVKPNEEPKAEPIVEPKEERVLSGLFDLEDIPVKAKSGRRMISLYGDGVPREINPKPQTPEPEPEPTPAPKPEPIVTEAPKEQQEVEQPKRIGDILGSKTTLADQMIKDDAPTTPFNRITDIRKAMGLNDRFLMIRDLFAGDAERFEATIDTINEFDDLDECMIYIVENFKWNPDSEGAKLLVSLIERKLA